MSVDGLTATASGSPPIGILAITVVGLRLAVLSPSTIGVELYKMKTNEENANDRDKDNTNARFDPDDEDLEVKINCCTQTVLIKSLFL